MLIVELPLNEELFSAESALAQANSDNVVALCRRYLLLLNAYHDELSRKRAAAGFSRHQPSLARELTRPIGRAYRSTLESTVCKRDSTASLLSSFISISGREVVEVLNRLSHQGFADWELLAGGARSKRRRAVDSITLRDAVEIAGYLRREAYVTKKIIFFKEL